MKTLLAFLALLACAAHAQPYEFLDHYNSLPNAATAYDTFCFLGKWPCVERERKAWGQVCHAPYGDINYYAGIVPYGFRAVRWRCDLEHPVGRVATHGDIVEGQPAYATNEAN